MGKVAVIGSNSFSGSHFVDFLLSNTRHTVIGTSRSPEKKDIYLPYKKSKNLHRFRFHKFDLNQDMAALLEFLDRERPEIVVNYAAQNEVGPSWDNPVHWYRTNSVAVVALTHHLKDQKYLKRYVQISSPEIYGASYGNVYENAPYNPSTPYAASKAAGDMFIQVLIRNLNFPATIIRSTNVYGPGQQLFKIVPKAIVSIKLGQKIPLHGGGKAIKSYIHIRDACNGTLRAIELGKPGEIYHLSPASGYTVKSIVQRICDRLGKDFNDAVEVAEERLGQDAAYIINSDKARKELHWEPRIGIDEGLQECIDWANENWKIVANERLTYAHKP